MTGEVAAEIVGMIISSMFALFAALIPILFIALWGFGIIVGILSLVFWILMLLDCVQRETFQMGSDDAQLMWILIIVLGGTIGAIIYFFMEKKEDEDAEHLFLPG